MAGKTFTCTLQVRWGDSDRLGHVNNTRFVEYLQEGRVQFLNAVLGGSKQRGAAVVRKLVTDFLHPILDDSGPLTIELWVTRIGTTSYGVRHVVTDRDGKVCADAEATMVAFDLATSSSRPLDEHERGLLTEYLHVE
ncbi:4-hydroxybenzoyl-CoA thioesterase [Rhodococcus sp. 06-418-5]|uniref:acyl-CoA thioesterase n=1 Tax=unclassified Rhodococcus (in: high G+C Gram-positive bacteria) TaxID=192944 RepID=UPI0005D76243|nr:MULTISPECIES: acyl-CoA thioesterase [unclassified Rhodococcus (in: high G+C Gram-positive bacteria)]AJW38394.1 Thioesterase [Rhodococcus sp. B7740]OZC70205.1 4-hydroxybenzoyl-CoA thioesterase [Rhodococcus sp. 06-470-2]OZC80374.1 4-hydroxybenzoyl-CoA thioesterase [Rhodococcus sp. 06-418-5]OZE59762.1 4-hydroxybenzoyl-CoA thioesterase [Rhodococcus sp. 05-2221-1B]